MRKVTIPIRSFRHQGQQGVVKSALLIVPKAMTTAPNPLELTRPFARISQQPSCPGPVAQRADWL